MALQSRADLQNQVIGWPRLGCGSFGGGTVVRFPEFGGYPGNVGLDAVVIWITGLSGAGKTSLCDALGRMLKPCLPQLVRIDGDAVRQLFGDALEHTEADRKVQIGRIQRLAKMLSEQGLVVLVAALYCHPDLLAWNRTNLTDYFEVYLDAPLDLVERRDNKGLYAGAAAGEEISRRLGEHRCRIVELPKKDANDCLKAGHDDLREFFDRAKTRDPEELRPASDYFDRVLKDFYPSEGTEPGCSLPWNKATTIGYGH